MRIYTKEYYTLMMGLGTVDMYEPVIDKDYTDEEIEELYQKALDKYIEEERADYDEPPVLIIDEDGEPEDPEEFALELAEYERREPFREKEAEEEFREMYEDNLEEPDEDLPEWVREQVDPRILAMYFMPEKIYRELSAEDEANSERFETLDENADEAVEFMRGDLPDELEEIMDILEELEDSYVLSISAAGRELEMKLEGWDEDGEEAVYTLRFDEVGIIENEGVEAHAEVDEDGDTESDCELLYSEIHIEDGMPEFHMMFDNNGLKYLTFTCEEAFAYMAANE